MTELELQLIGGIRGTGPCQFITTNPDKLYFIAVDDSGKLVGFIVDSEDGELAEVGEDESHLEGLQIKAFTWVSKVGHRDLVVLGTDKGVKFQQIRCYDEAISIHNTKYSSLLEEE